MKKIVTLLLLSFSLSSFAQNITGTITDSETKKPIQGASVTIKDGKAGGATNSNGQFSLKGSGCKVSGKRSFS